MAWIRTGVSAWALQTVGYGPQSHAPNTADYISAGVRGGQHYPELAYVQLPVEAIPFAPIWSKPEEATGQFTLAADQGTYALTGVAAGLIAARTLAAAQGTYNLTGVAATLTKGFILAAAQGSYTLTGVAGGLTAARVLAAAQGSYALTGIAAGLVAARLLTAAQGSYALTGQAATLIKGFALTAASGAYVLAGQSVTFTLGGTPAAVVDAFSGGWKRRRRKRETLPDLADPKPEIVAPEYAPLKGEYRPYEPSPVGRSPELEKIAARGLAQLREIENLSRTQRARQRAERLRRMREDEEWLLLD